MAVAFSSRCGFRLQTQRNRIGNAPHWSEPLTTIMEIEVSDEEMCKLHDELTATIQAANAAIQTVQTLGGDDPGARILRTELNRGASYFRQAAL